MQRNKIVLSLQKIMGGQETGEGPGAKLRGPKTTPGRLTHWSLLLV